MKTIFTKQEVAEIATAPIDDQGTGVKRKVADKLAKYSDIKLLKSVRKSTGLNFMMFAPGKFYIKYQN